MSDFHTVYDIPEIVDKRFSIDYHSTAAAQTIGKSVTTVIANNGLGTDTDTSTLAPGIEKLFDPSNGRFYFEGLELGTILEIRVDGTITANNSLHNNLDVEMHLQFQGMTELGANTNVHTLKVALPGMHLGTRTYEVLQNFVVVLDKDELLHGYAEMCIIPLDQSVDFNLNSFKIMKL